MSFDTCIITCLCHCIIVQWYCTLISLYKILSLNWKSSVVYLFIPPYPLMSGNHWSFYCLHQFSSVQSLSHVQLFATPWIAAHQASLSITNSQSSLKLMSIKTMIPSSHLILCHPQLLLPPIPPSIRVFSKELILFAWGGQSVGVSASASVLPMNTQDWSPLGLTGWVS